MLKKQSLKIIFSHKSLIESCPISYSAGEISRMAKFKVIVSDPETGTSKVVELEESRAAPFIGRKLGEIIDGAVVDLPAHTSANNRWLRQRRRPNERKRTWRSSTKLWYLAVEQALTPRKKEKEDAKPSEEDTITDEIVQINMKIVERPAGKATEVKAQSNLRSNAKLSSACLKLIKLHN